MNHIRAILDVPAEWRIYRRKQAEYIAKKLEGKHPHKPTHPIGWTMIALGLVCIYGGLLTGFSILVWYFAPLSLYIIGSVVAGLWGIISIAVATDHESYAEEERNS